MLDRLAQKFIALRLVYVIKICWSMECEPAINQNWESIFSKTVRRVTSQAIYGLMMTNITYLCVILPQVPKLVNSTCLSFSSKKFLKSWRLFISVIMNFYRAILRCDFKAFYARILKVTNNLDMGLNFDKSPGSS